MSLRFPTLILCASAMAVLPACASTSNALGLRKDAPNEFNILTNAPLVVPPEYNLRPPAPGESSGFNNYSQKSARAALIGDVDPAEPTRGEVVFLTRAGATRSDPEIRIKLDGQNAVERKSDSFANRVLFFDGVQRDGQGNPIPLDSEGERARLEGVERVTGGGEVTITRKPGRAKLPGL